jgi:hypothetical protein
LSLSKVGQPVNLKGCPTLDKLKHYKNACGAILLAGPATLLQRLSLVGLAPCCDSPKLSRPKP